MLRPLLLAFALTAIGGHAASAQYRRPVFAYDNGCYSTTLVASRNGQRLMDIPANTYGVRGLDGGRVGMLEVGAPGKLTESTPLFYDEGRVDLAVFAEGISSGGSCRWRIELLPTDSLVRRFRGLAEAAGGRASGIKAAATGFFIGALALTAGTLYYTSRQIDTEGEAEALPLIAGLSVAGVAAWGGGQLLDLAREPRQTRDKYRNFERWILEQSR